MAAVVTCPNKDCRDEHGQRAFLADEPARTVEKVRHPGGHWEYDPKDPSAPPTFVEAGEPVTVQMDVYPCPRCGSPVAVER